MWSLYHITKAGFLEEEGKLPYKRLIGRGWRRTHPTGWLNEIDEYKLGVHNLGFGLNVYCWQHLAQRHMFCLGDAIICVNKDDVWYQQADFLFVVLSVADDNHD